MGASFGNIHIRDTAVELVAEVLRSAGSTPAHIAGPVGAWVSVYPGRGDYDAQALIMAAGGLSQRLDRPTIAIMVHDSDVLYYWLFDHGRLIDSYVSDPGYFEGESSAPEGGRTEVLQPLCVAGTTVEALEQILHPDPADLSDDDDDEDFAERPYDFAEDQARDLAACLGIPPESASLGFGYISKGEAPVGEVTLLP